MKTTKHKFIRLVTTSLLAATALVSMLIPATANAVPVTGNAIFTIDNDAVASSIPFPGYSFEKHWGEADNAIVIDGSGGTSIPSTGSTALTFAVNTNGADIVYAAEDRVTRFTDMDANNTSVGQIGLSGALQLNGSNGLVSPKDFYMEKAGGIWNVQGPFTGFGDPTLFTLKNVTESSNANGLYLSGDLYWASTGYNWTAITAGDGSVKLGTFSLAPVPVPAAVWLFGTGLIGLIAGRRRTNSIA